MCGNTTTGHVTIKRLKHSCDCSLGQREPDGAGREGRCSGRTKRKQTQTRLCAEDLFPHLFKCVSLSVKTCLVGRKKIQTRVGDGEQCGGKTLEHEHVVIAGMAKWAPERAGGGIVVRSQAALIPQTDHSTGGHAKLNSKTGR